MLFLPPFGVSLLFVFLIGLRLCISLSPFLLWLRFVFRLFLSLSMYIVAGVRLLRLAY